MPMPRSDFIKRTVLGLAALGVMALATGCDTGTATPTTAPEDAKAQNKAMMEAMQKGQAESTKKTH